MDDRNASDNVVATEETNFQENALATVLLPGNGVSYTETAEALATAYRNEKNPEIRLYNRGGAVCCIDKDRDGGLKLQGLNSQRACSEFERVAAFGKRKNVKGDVPGACTIEPTVCPPSIANTILQSSQFLNSLPKVTLITNSPVIVDGENNDCRVINTYDEATGIFPTGIPVPELSVAEAVKLIEDAMVDFNFQSEGDKSRAIAALLSPALAAGSVLDARAPVMMLEADKSQSGKGYFTKMLGAIYNETPVTVTQRGGGTGSLDENFDAALCSGRQFIVLDNLRGKMNSPQIEAFLTSECHLARMPYAPQVEVEPKRYFIMATSNNYELTIDMANRSNIIRIRKQRLGYGFRSFPEGDILSHIKANQPRYLGAVFAIIREWVRQGKPKHDSAIHDFRDWCRTLDWIVRNIFHRVPLMEGHLEAQLITVHPEISWVSQVFNVVNTLAELEKPLTAYALATCCDVGDVELPGSLGIPLDDLDDKGKAQVCSQIGRRMNGLFKKLDCEDEVHLGSFIVTRKSLRQVYASGKSEYATVFMFQAA